MPPLCQHTDLPEIRAILNRQRHFAIFPLFNLRLHGLVDLTAASNPDHAMYVWQLADGVLCQTFGGMIMPVSPAATVQDYEGISLPRPPIGILGEERQVKIAREGLGLTDQACRLEKDEPHFHLALGDLKMPQLDGLSLRRPDQTDRDLLVSWRTAYNVEALGAAPDVARDEAAESIDRYLKTGSHRILMSGETPVSFAGWNALVDNVVQIGGVYTPPELRGQGYGRTGVALLLAELSKSTCTDAILFAANEPAARAYRALGFQRIGTFSLVLFNTNQGGRA